MSCPLSLSPPAPREMPSSLEKEKGTAGGRAAGKPSLPAGVGSEAGRFLQLLERAEVFARCFSSCWGHASLVAGRGGGFISSSGAGTGDMTFPHPPWEDGGEGKSMKKQDIS